MNHTMALKQFKELYKGSDQNSPADCYKLMEQTKWKPVSLEYRKETLTKKSNFPYSGENSHSEMFTEMKLSVDSQALDRKVGRRGQR